MRALFIALLLAITCCSCAMASDLSGLLDEESPYSAMVVGTQLGPQSNDWTYTLVNTSYDSNFVIWCLQIEVDEDTLVDSVTTPQGWVANRKIPHIIQWTPTEGSLAASSAQTGFGAKFSQEPAYQYWTVNFDNSISGESPVYFGLVESPEPASVAAMITGLVSFAGFIRRRRV